MVDGLCAIQILQRLSAGGGTISRGVLYQRGVLYASRYGISLVKLS
jgi:hypothetical protein